MHMHVIIPYLECISFPIVFRTLRSLQCQPLPSKSIYNCHLTIEVEEMLPVDGRSVTTDAYNSSSGASSRRPAAIRAVHVQHVAASWTGSVLLQPQLQTRSAKRVKKVTNSVRWSMIRKLGQYSQVK